MPRGDDEHMNVPTWRVRQLQAIEDAARESVELLSAEHFEAGAVLPVVRVLLSDALEAHQ